MNLFITLMYMVVLHTLVVTQVWADEDKNPRLNAVGITVSDLGNPFFASIAETIRSRVRDNFGDKANIIIRSNAYSNSRLESQMRSFISDRVDIIFLVASDQKFLKPLIKLAQNNEIIVVAIDVNADGADITVTSDNTQAGRLACKYLAEQIGGNGKIAIVNGPPVSSVLERVDGCRNVLKNYSDVKIISEDISGGGSWEGGVAAMAVLIENYPELDGIFAINDPTASGAVLLVEQSGRTDLVVVSVDGSPEAINAFKSKSKIWRASAAQFPNVMANTAYDLSIELLVKQKLIDTKVLIPPKIIHENNVDQYDGWD